MGFGVDGDAVVGFNVGDKLVGDSVGVVVVGEALEGESVVGEFVVGPSVVGFPVVGESVVGTSVGEFVVGDEVRVRSCTANAPYEAVTCSTRDRTMLCAVDDAPPRDASPHVAMLPSSLRAKNALEVACTCSMPDATKRWTEASKTPPEWSSPHTITAPLSFNAAKARCVEVIETTSE